VKHRQRHRILPTCKLVQTVNQSNVVLNVWNRCNLIPELIYPVTKSWAPKHTSQFHTTYFSQKCILPNAVIVRHCCLPCLSLFFKFSCKVVVFVLLLLLLLLLFTVAMLVVNLHVCKNSCCYAQYISIRTHGSCSKCIHTSKPQRMRKNRIKLSNVKKKPSNNTIVQTKYFQRVIQHCKIKQTVQTIRESMVHKIEQKSCPQNSWKPAKLSSSTYACVRTNTDHQPLLFKSSQVNSFFCKSNET